MPVNVAKTRNKWGALVAIETGNYGSGTPALAPSTDGVLVYEEPIPALAYQHDGAREGMAGTGTSELSPIGASGRSASVDLVHYFKGAGAAYSASVRAQVDRLLRGLGMSATVGGGVGTERVDYALLADGGPALVAELYARGQRYNLTGAVVQRLVIEADGHGVPKWTFGLVGIAGTPVDAAVPAITYSAGALKTPKAAGITLTLTNGAAFAGVVRRHTLTIERELTERVSQAEANGGHAGVVLGPWTASLELTMEATALVPGAPHLSATAFDPYRVFENGIGAALALTVGGTAYNRYKVAAPNAMLSGPPTEDTEGPLALWTLPFKLHPTADGLADTLTLTTD